MHKILVINPNSNVLVTEKMQDSFNNHNSIRSDEVDCITLSGAPFGIETDADIKFVEPLIVNKISDELENYDAFIIACYSDPGLNEATQTFKKPIYGIHETSVKFCTKLRHNFGVIALGDESIQRHINYIKALNLESYYIGENALNISVNEAVSDKSTFSKIIISGRDLIEKKGVEMIILGCAGLAKHRAAVERELGVKVIDPVQTSVEIAVDNLIN